MKKITAILFLTMSCGLGYGQGNGHHGNSNTEHWDVFGNSIDASDVFGTINNLPINFIVNSIQKMTLDVNGNLKLNNLAGTGNRVLLANSSGLLTALPQGSSGQFLQSDGTWGSLPAAVTAWTGTGNKLSLGAGSLLGIGVTPSYPLDVAGTAHISNDLIVDGGVVLTDINKTASGIQLNVGGSANFTGPVTARQGVMFNSAGSKGITFTPASGSSPDVINFGNTSGFRPLATACAAPNQPGLNFGLGGNVQIYHPSDPNSGLLNIQNWSGGSSIDASVGGNTGAGGLLLNYFCGRDVSICKGPNGGFVSMGDNVEIGSGFVRDPSVSFFMNSRLDNTAMQIQGNFSAGSPNNYITKYYTSHTQSKVISVQDAQEGYFQSFLLYGDGSTHMGKNVQIGYNNSAIQDQGTALNIDANQKKGIFIHTYDPTSANFPYTGLESKTTHGNDFGYNILARVNRDLTKALVVGNEKSTYYEPFVVFGNGKTRIGFDTQTGTGPHGDAMLTVGGASGKIVAKSIYVTIQNWADCVFDPGYKLPNLYEIEAYYRDHKHLSEIPSEKEVIENGVSLGEMNRLLLKKVEELTILMVQQQKEIDMLKQNQQR